MTDNKLTPDQQMTIMAIVTKLATLGHELSFVHPISEGPLVTTYRFVPKGMAKVRQIEALSSDIALALAVEDVLIRRLPGESVIGITIPRKDRQIPLWRNLVCRTKDIKIPLLFGVDSLGDPFIDDLALLPHLLITGSTGGGKSVLLRSLVATIVYTMNSSDVQFILSDTKQVEFGHFIGAPHLLFDPITSYYQTLEKMDWLSEQIELRLKVMARCGAQNIADYNLGSNKCDQMSYIVLVIDELADIIGGGSKRGENKVAQDKLARIVQKSRATGIHVIAATQRSSTDVINGTTKSNFPARLTFRLPTEVDSRTVLTSGGAEHLLARGDMLYLSPNRQSVTRLHSAYASIDDIKGAIQAATLTHLCKTR